MTSYLIKRLLLAVGTLLVILSLSYLLLRLAPGDPSRSTLLSSDGGAGTMNVDRSETLGNQSLRKELFLDRPIYIGFGHWLKKIITRGDFGASATVAPGVPVFNLIMERLPVTLTLNVWAVLITYIIAIPLGVFTAVKAGTKSDYLISFGLFFLYSLPGVWVGIILQSFLCEGGILPVFPLKGVFNGDATMLGTFQIMYQEAFHYVLPVLCLSYAGIAGLSRYARAGMLEVLGADFIRTARAKGVPEGEVIWHHAFRNALISLITLFSGLLPGLVAGSIIVEYVFNLPGMGQLSLDALSSRDYPLQMALFAMAGVLTLGGIILSDIGYMLADPRISLAGNGCSR